MILRVKYALFTRHWQGIGVFFEPRSPAKAAGFLKAYVCTSCLVPLQGTKDTGAIQLAALSAMQGKEMCCTGCVALEALRNWSCVYLLLVYSVFTKWRRVFISKIADAVLCPMASEGERLASGAVNKGQTHALCKLFH